MGELLGLPELASAHGGDLDDLNIIIHWLMFVLFIGWGAFLAYTLFRFRRKKNPEASYQGVKTHAARYAEYGVILAEAILLIGFSIPLWSDRVDDFPEESESTVARVVGEQFAWNVHYPGPDGQFGRTDAQLVDVQSNPLGIDPDDPAGEDDVTTLNQLHLPVDKPALIYLTSKDVIHGFMLNEFRVKQDAVPGLETPVWFTPTVTTAEMAEQEGQPDYRYEIACAQLCGLGHYRMRGFVTIHEQADFDTWLGAEVEKSKARANQADSIWN
jgi:cytochrome c oxidase subunit II